MSTGRVEAEHLTRIAESLCDQLPDYFEDQAKRFAALSSRLTSTQQQLAKAIRERDEARRHTDERVLSVVGEMIARPPRGDFATKLDNVAYWIDKYDEIAGFEGATEVQDEIRDWARRLQEALGA